MTIGRNVYISVVGLFLCALLLLTGCGKETPETAECKAETGETIQAVLDTKDDFHMKYTSGVLMVYQKKKLMMQIAFLNEEQRQAQVDHMRDGNMSRVLKEEGKRISYEKTDAQGLVNYFIFPVGETTYAYCATYLPEKTAESVLQRLTLKVAGK